MRTFVVGDIHGAYQALVQVLKRSGFKKKTDRLITIGDICDGWPEVKQCVSELLTIKNRIDILGNHDAWFIHWLKTGNHPDDWIQGGEGTRDSYRILDQADAVPEDHRRFFYQQHRYYIDDEYRCFVHGGFDWKHPIKGQNTENLTWDRDLWDHAKEMEYEGREVMTANKFTKIFIGHTAIGAAIPLKMGGVWNLDSSAGFDGKLTIMDVDTEQYWQSDFVKTLYPARSGRLK